MAPGIQKLNIPKAATTSPKAAIANNLRTTTLSSGTSYGIFAQRSKIGMGLHLNNKLYGSGSISATRHALNDNRVALFNNIGDFHKCNHNNGGNTMNKFMAGMMAVNMLAQMTAQTVDAIKGAKASKSGGKKDVDSTNDPAIKAQSSPTPGSITEMKGAKDSSTLRGAIESAKSEKSKMKTDLSALEAKLPSMKEASEAATKQLEELKPKVAEAEEARKTAEANKNDAESNKNASEKALKGAEEMLTGAKEGLVNAKNDLISAKQSLGAARATLAATPETITQVDADGNTKEVHNPEYDKATQAVKDAEAKVHEAQTALDNANKEYSAAADANKNAQDAFNKAVNQLASAEENFAEMKGKFEKLDAEYKKLEGQQSEAQKKVDDYNEALKNQTDWKAAIAQFETEIPAQEKRLTELETKEEKGYDAARTMLDKLNMKMNGKDGIADTGDEKKLKGKDKENYDNATNLRRNVNYTKLYKTQGETVNGKTFRTNSYDGETLYMIGARKVSAGEYDAEITKAKGAELGKVGGW